MWLISLVPFPKSSIFSLIPSGAIDLCYWSHSKGRSQISSCWFTDVLSASRTAATLMRNPSVISDCTDKYPRHCPGTIGKQPHQCHQTFLVQLPAWTQQSPLKKQFLMYCFLSLRFFVLRCVSAVTILVLSSKCTSGLQSFLLPWEKSQTFRCNPCFSYSVYSNMHLFILFSL